MSCTHGDSFCLNKVEESPGQAIIAKRLAQEKSLKRQMVNKPEPEEEAEMDLPVILIEEEEEEDEEDMVCSLESFISPFILCSSIYLIICAFIFSDASRKRIPS